MKARFNPTGTHVEDDFLKVRFDLYPDVGDKTYPIHHILVPVIPLEGYQGEVDDMGSPVDQNDYDNWRDSLPKIWQLNPALCAFIRVSETIIKGELEAFTHQLFNKDTIKTLDDILIKPDSIHWVSPFMRGKLVLSDQKVQTKDIADLIGSVNSRFADLILPLEGNGKIINIEPQTIDIGTGAAEYASNFTNGYTTVEEGNPANAIGTLDTVEIWAFTSLSGTIVGTFYKTNGSTLKCRDSVSIGNVTSGSKQTFSGLSITVETNDYIGVYWTGGFIRFTTGYTGIWYVSGEFIDPNDETSYTYSTGSVIALYGTGTEVGVEAAELGAFYQRRSPLGLNIQTAGQVRAG